MSAKVLLFSDPHFGHKNMAIKRGFLTVEDHDNCIINNWNSVVNKADTVWLLGDVTMEKANFEILKRLNGTINVVGGNHDKPQHTRKMLEFVNSFSGMAKLKGCVLTHCPIHPSEVTRFKLNIHGHVHEKSLEDKRFFNVSAEAINFTPIELNEILKITDSE